ncbi:family 78 glycoside hydrolase catalytic domain [Streptomyces sp. NPDC005811]|uniref:family 78 glycoside hydrolase catalytic domain n=1 Tax=Streptomyces sp. NPDC005811 TaxID=3154565 RepID=UPI003408039E
MPAVRITDTFGPVGVTRSDRGTKVYDFGRITAGWTRISVKGSRGTKVTLTCGQMHIDSYTLSGAGREVWEPRFIRHGFQYVEVSCPDDALSTFRIEARENHTALESTGTFCSGNPLLDRIHENQRRSLLLDH